MTHKNMILDGITVECIFVLLSPGVLHAWLGSTLFSLRPLSAMIAALVSRCCTRVRDAWFGDSSEASKHLTLWMTFQQMQKLTTSPKIANSVASSTGKELLMVLLIPVMRRNKTSSWRQQAPWKTRKHNCPWFFSTFFYCFLRVPLIFNSSWFGWSDDWPQVMLNL